MTWRSTPPSATLAARGRTLSLRSSYDLWADRTSGGRLGAEPDSCHAIQTDDCLIPPPPHGTLAGLGPQRTNPSRMTMRSQSEQEAGNGDTEKQEMTQYHEKDDLRFLFLFFFGFFSRFSFFSNRSKFTIASQPSSSVARRCAFFLWRQSKRAREGASEGARQRKNFLLLLGLQATRGQHLQQHSRVKSVTCG